MSINYSEMSWEDLVEEGRKAVKGRYFEYGSDLVDEIVERMVNGDAIVCSPTDSEARVVDCENGTVSYYYNVGDKFDRYSCCGMESADYNDWEDPDNETDDEDYDPLEAPHYQAYAWVAGGFKIAMSNPEIVEIRGNMQ